ncbi:hypothetical protein QBC39DRAFT_387227 [Podospora conica]|nr:hypothetical protein QBC39DRAFT_387227 [Schizothecium conicum]
MTSRGRGRHGPRSSAEPVAAPGGRRSARGQQPPQVQEEQDSIESQIDPAITGDTTGSMAPPPPPTAKKARSQSQENAHAKDIPRRGARPAASQAASVASINSVPTSSQDLQSTWAPATSVSQRDVTVDPSASQPSATQQKIRVNRMKKGVPGLIKAATDYYQHLSTPIPPTPEDREVWEGEKEILSQIFSPQRNIFIPNGEPMISATEVHQQLRIPQDDPEWLATTQAIALANIAALWENMVEHPPHQLRFLHLLEATFPDFYIPLGPDGFTIDHDGILHQIQEIRTQHLILKLRLLQTESQFPFNPYQEILNIFCRPNVETNHLLQVMQNNLERLDFKDIPGIVDDDWSNWTVTSMMTRISALCKELPNEEVRDVNAQLQSLEDGYSFNTFLEAFKEFTSLCFNEISGQLSNAISHADTSSQIQTQLEAELARANAAAGVPRTQAALSGMLALDAMEQQGRSDRLATQDIVERSVRDGLYPSATNASYPAFAGYGDPPSHANGSVYATSAAQASRKRSFEEDEDEDGNPAKQPRSRRKNVARRRPADAKPLGRTMKSASELGFPHMPASVEEPDFEAVTQRSREISAAKRIPKKPQERNQWVREDIKALVRAVDTYKCKWSLIEREIEAGTIPFKLKRNQQALRDKARLLKQDFLKADAHLPPSFDLVVLGKKERNNVIACGKNPDRKEDDLIDGRPVNTEWRGEEAAEQTHAMESASPDAAPVPSGGAPEANMDVSLDAEDQS